MGVLAASFVLILAFTGLCLNHVSGWGFDRKALRSPILLSLYGMEEIGIVKSYPFTGSFVSEINGQLFYQGNEIARCEGALVGVMIIPTPPGSPIVLACEQQLLLFSPTFQLIEKIGSTLGLPVAIKRLGLRAGRLVIDTSRGLYFADLNTLSWTVVEAGAVPSSTQWSEARQTPESLRLVLAGAVDREDLTYERLLLDIHSGRILGEWGVYLVDIMGILFMLLAISGLVIWLKGKKV